MNLVSKVVLQSKILKAFIIDEHEYLQGICNDSYPFMPRQKLPKTYMSNGAIYIVEIKKFLQNPTFLQDKTSYYIMDTQSSIDIDSIEDLQKAENYLYKRK